MGIEVAEEIAPDQEPRSAAAPSKLASDVQPLRVEEVEEEVGVEMPKMQKDEVDEKVPMVAVPQVEEVDEGAVKGEAKEGEESAPDSQGEGGGPGESNGDIKAKVHIFTRRQ